MVGNIRSFLVACAILSAPSALATPPIRYFPPPEEVPDRSLSLEEFTKRGLPSPEKPWSAEDRLGAFTLLKNLAATDHSQLPRVESATSGKLFELLLTRMNGGLSDIYDRQMHGQFDNEQVASYVHTHRIIFDQTAKNWTKNLMRYHELPADAPERRQLECQLEYIGNYSFHMAIMLPQLKGSTCRLYWRGPARATFYTHLKEVLPRTLVLTETAVLTTEIITEEQIEEAKERQRQMRHFVIALLRKNYRAENHESAKLIISEIIHKITPLKPMPGDAGRSKNR